MQAYQIKMAKSPTSERKLGEDVGTSEGTRGGENSSTLTTSCQYPHLQHFLINGH